MTKRKATRKDPKSPLASDGPAAPTPPKPPDSALDDAGDALHSASVPPQKPEQPDIQVEPGHSDAHGLRAVLEAISDGVWDQDLSTGAVTFSNGYWRMLGYAADAPRPASAQWQDRIHPDDKPIVSTKFEEHLAGWTDRFKAEYRLLTNQGDWRWVQSSGKVIAWNPDGTAQRIVGAVNDVSERKRMEEALRKSEQRYALATASGQVGVWDWDLRTNTLYIDPRLKQMLGYHVHEIENRWSTLATLAHPEDRDRILAQGQDCLEGRRSGFELTFRILHKSGAVRWMIARGLVISAPDGARERLLGTGMDITELKLASEQAAKTHQQLRAILDTIPGTVRVVDQDQRLIELNEMAVRQLGLKDRAQAIGRQCHEVCRLFPNHCEQCGLRQAMESGETTTRLTDAEAAPVLGGTFTISAAPIRNDAGAIWGAVECAMDVTDLHMAQEALLRRERILLALNDSSRLLLAHSPFPPCQAYIEIIGPASGAGRVGLYLFRNGTDEDDQAELVARWMRQPTVVGPAQKPPPPYAELPATWMERLRSGAIVAGRADEFPESERPFLSRLSIASILVLPISADDAFLGFIVFKNLDHAYCWEPSEIEFLRISAAGLAQAIRRHQIETALRESENKHRAMLEAMTDQVYICSAEYRIEYMNPAMIRRLGRDATGEICYQALEDLDDVCPWCVSERVVHQGRSHTWEVTSPRDGRTYHICNTPIRQPDGTVSKMAIIRDITERKIAEQERRQLEEKALHARKLESLNIMACGIAHDFNNLLMAVLGNADLALNELEPSHPLYPLIQEMESAAQRAAELSGRMLAYSGHGRAQTCETRLAELVASMQETLAAATPPDVRVMYHFEDELPAIDADSEQIQRMILDLFLNAAEALEDMKGIISISARTVEMSRKALSETYIDDGLPGGAYVRLEVADSGRGMDEETLPKIFDPFFTTRFTGRGLGLPSVLGVIRSHSGAINIHSAPGRGTICEIFLPALPTAADAGLVPQDYETEWQTATDAGQPIILLVDDEQTVRAVTTRMLHNAGRSVITAPDGVQGLEIFRQRHQDLAAVILDLTMPNMDGATTFREMRKIRPDMPILLSSGYSESEVQQRFGDTEPDGFIRKPYRAGALIAKLEEITRR